VIVHSPEFHGPDGPELGGFRPKGTAEFYEGFGAVAEAVFDVFAEFAEG
jgi:hypothetical protein